MADPENTLREGGLAITCGQRPPTSSNGTLGRFLTYIAKFGALLRSATDGTIQSYGLAE